MAEIYPVARLFKWEENVTVYHDGVTRFPRIGLPRDLIVNQFVFYGDRPKDVEFRVSYVHKAMGYLVSPWLPLPAFERFPFYIDARHLDDWFFEFTNRARDLNFFAKVLVVGVFPFEPFAKK